MPRKTFVVTQEVFDWHNDAALKHGTGIGGGFGEVLDTLYQSWREPRFVILGESVAVSTDTKGRVNALVLSVNYAIDSDRNR